LFHLRFLHNISYLLTNLSIASTWAHDSINQAFELGLIPAALQNNYTANITRAEFAPNFLIL